MSAMNVTAVGPFSFLIGFASTPLGEFVHGDEQMRHAAARRLEWAHPVQSPNGKGPSEGNGLECRGRHVLLGAEELASLAMLD